MTPLSKFHLAALAFLFTAAASAQDFRGPRSMPDSTSDIPRPVSAATPAETPAITPDLPAPNATPALRTMEVHIEETSDPQKTVQILPVHPRENFPAGVTVLEGLFSPGAGLVPKYRVEAFFIVKSPGGGWFIYQAGIPPCESYQSTSDIKFHATTMALGDMDHLFSLPSDTDLDAREDQEVPPAKVSLDEAPAGTLPRSHLLSGGGWIVRVFANENLICLKASGEDLVKIAREHPMYFNIVLANSAKNNASISDLLATPTPPPSSILPPKKPFVVPHGSL